MATAEEKAAAKAAKEAEKLEKLRAEATELKVEFTEETTAEELSEKIKAAKAAAKEDAKPKKTSFDVHNAGGTLVRTYSVEQHGKNAGDLAEEYAKKIKGEVK